MRPPDRSRTEPPDRPRAAPKRLMRPEETVTFTRRTVLRSSVPWVHLAAIPPVSVASMLHGGQGQSLFQYAQCGEQIIDACGISPQRCGDVIDPQGPQDSHSRIA